MKTIETVRELRANIKEAIRKGKSIGFVPTMGFLHEGHLSLMKRARMETDVVITSIFVNPTQFGPNEDFEAYPRDMVKDTMMTRDCGVDYLFTPSVEEMYPDGFTTYVEVEGEITRQLCGKSRPGHFKGVTTVVSKLLNMVTPDFAYFGQKDAQQVIVIQKMVSDLNFDVGIVPCSIIREDDGLAMSSRNTYLAPELREEAQILSQSLFSAEKLIYKGKRDSQKIKDFLIERISSAKHAEIEYIEVVNGRSLQKVEKIAGDVLIALAVKFGKTRLIDNIGLVM